MFCIDCGRYSNNDVYVVIKKGTAYIRCDRCKVEVSIDEISKEVIDLRDRLDEICTDENIDALLKLVEMAGLNDKEIAQHAYLGIDSPLARALRDLAGETTDIDALRKKQYRGPYEKPVVKKGKRHIIEKPRPPQNRLIHEGEITPREPR